MTDSQSFEARLIARVLGDIDPAKLKEQLDWMQKLNDTQMNDFVQQIVRNSHGTSLIQSLRGRSGSTEKIDPDKVKQELLQQAAELRQK